MGEGFHARAGGPHAEVARPAAGRVPGARRHALRARSSRARTRAARRPARRSSRDAGVARVVAALRDPNPLVTGRGLSLLRRAGIAVETGLLAAEAARLNERFLAWRAARPALRPAEGGPHPRRADRHRARASRSGSRAPPSARQARWLRRLHDAVLVGVGTALADDPLLLPSPRTRRPFHAGRARLAAAPARSTAGSPARPRARARPRGLVRAGPGGRRRALEARGVEVLDGARAQRARVAARGARGALRRRGVTSLMVEGGAEVLGSFLAAAALRPGGALPRAAPPGRPGQPRRPSAGPIPCDVAGRPAPRAGAGRAGLPVAVAAPVRARGAPGDRLTACSPASWKARARFARRSAAATC